MIKSHKESNLGEIPNNWEVKKLGDFLNVNTGNKNAQDSKEDGVYPFFTRSVTTQNIDTYSYDTEALFIAGEGIFKVKYYRGKFDVHQRTYILTTKEGIECSMKFFQNQIQSRILRLVDTSVGSTVQSLRKPIIQNLELIYPPLPEQQKIADILSTVDAKIEIIDQQITETQELKKGLMQRLLTKGIGHSEFKDSALGEIPVGWKVVKIQDLLDNGSIISHLDGNHGGLYPKANEFIDEGVPYIGANCFLNNSVDFSKCKHLSMERSLKFRKGVAKNGDVLFAHNATVGPVAYLETDLDFVILSTTATYFRLDNKTIDARYWLFFLSSPTFKNQYEKVMGQSTRNQVPITMQRSFYTVLPSFEEQKEISEIINTSDEKLKVLLEKKTTYQELKKGLMQQLLTGKVRVKV